MASVTRESKSIFIPPPIDGLNLISPPSQLKDTEARQLDNYYVYDWGIRQRGYTALAKTMPSKVRLMIPFYDPVFDATYHPNGPRDAALVMCINDSNIYLCDCPNFVSIPALATANVDTGLGTPAHTFFGGYIYIFGTTHLNKYSISAGTVALDPFTGGPAAGSIVSGNPYKNRFYCLGSNDTNLYYGPVAGVSGALSSFPLATIFNSNATPIYVGSFSTNQGLANDELLVIIGDNGEIIFYSGDSPLSSNWNLIGRSTIPPVSMISRSFLKLGNDILINTVRGVIMLSQVFQTRGFDASYYAVSRNLGPFSSPYTVIRANIALNSQDPFVYIPSNDNAGSGVNSLYVLNYERGAWSRFVEDTGNSYEIVMYSTNQSGQGSFLFYGDGSGNVRKVIDRSAASTGATITYRWSTPFFDFGKANQKISRSVRPLTRKPYIDGSYSTATQSTSCQISTNFSDTYIGTASTAAGAATSTGDYTIYVPELAPAGIGRQLSFSFIDTPSAGLGLKEILGFECIYDEGVL